MFTYVYMYIDSIDLEGHGRKKGIFRPWLNEGYLSSPLLGPMFAISQLCLRVLFHVQTHACLKN